MTSLPVSLVLILSLGSTLTWGQSVELLQQSMEVVTRQLMQLQSNVENAKRTSASSGIKAMRSNYVGSRPYLSGSFVERNLCGIHNHADHTHAVGLGEFTAVLNGVEFTTRHNDYKMKMRSTTTGDYNELEDVPMPEVPPEVLSKTTVEEKIDEMREWFKAWAMQDHSVRDYRPYFRPVLCYLECAWYHTDQSTIDESFESDRHHLDASSWLDLQEKARFNMETGHKDLLENYATLPTMITGFTSDGVPKLAQWNYKILCHPLKDDLPLNRFETVNDLQSRMKPEWGETMRDFKVSRVARFRLNSYDEDNWTYESSRSWRLLDQLMSAVPGMDNYQAQLIDDVYGAKAMVFDKSGGALNAGYYHRWTRQSAKDANGVNVAAKTFKDDELYMAMTTQPKISPNEITVCKKGVCNSWTQRWSYAVPLEIIYTTPLTSWNPYNILMNEEQLVERDADGNRRNGDNSPSKAYNGTSAKIYYQVPGAFFQGEVDRDPADTASDGVYVLDSKGEVRHVRASGPRLLLPNIPGVGILRQRYPIFPVYDEGTTTWKELSALKDAILYPGRFPRIVNDPTGASPYYEPKGLVDYGRDVIQEAVDGIFELPVILSMRPTTGLDSHIHFIRMTSEEVQAALTSGDVALNTTASNGHSHAVTVTINTRTRDDGSRYAVLIATNCDGEKLCPDGHSSRLSVM